MCGIAGVLATAETEEALRAQATTMASCLRHRGPDDGGVRTGPGWAVGMRRLAVQDPSPAGHQPMQLGHETLVFNGEVYNFRELRHELERVGYSFRSDGDAEVVLAALDRWGAAALERFNGMFALALVDQRRRRALLARDRFGKKPLFVARLRSGIAFASELKALMAVFGDELEVCPTSLVQFFRHRYVPAPATIFRQVRKLPAASWLEVDLDTADMTAPNTFWALPDPGDHTPASPLEVLEATKAAVRRRLVADVPVGAFLSGGTDSSLVVACMREAAEDVRTFSIGFADPRYDESARAAAVARHLGTRHLHRRLGPADAAEIVPILADVYDEPFADSSALPMLAVSRLARTEVTVALSGDGGDELFGGYHRYRLKPGVRLAGAIPVRAATLLRHAPGDAAIARRLRLLGTLGAAGGPDAVYTESTSVWRSPELAELFPGRLGQPLGADASTGAGRPGSTAAMMRRDLRTYLVDDILQKVDRASMSVSLEARNPLLDPEVVACAMRSTARAQESPGDKRLLREALALVLPHHLMQHPKTGFAVPLGDWLRGGLRPLVEDVVLDRGDAEYDTAVARRVTEGHLSGRHDEPQKVWTLLMFELWRQRWRAG